MQSTDEHIDLGIDLSGYDPERGISLRDVADRKLIPGRGNRKPHIQTLQRWCKHGCRPAGPDGPVLRLPAVKPNGEYMTMPEWVKAFWLEKVRLETPVPVSRRKVLSHGAAKSRLRERGIEVPG